MNAFFAMMPHVKKGSLKRPTDLTTFSFEQDVNQETKPKKLEGEALLAEMRKLEN